jgi:hypothetical protein
VFQCTGTTLVLRLGWSPDGQYLVTAHAMNGTVPTAQIVDRDGWTHDKDFVGHRMAVTCVVSYTISVGLHFRCNFQEEIKSRKVIICNFERIFLFQHL